MSTYQSMRDTRNNKKKKIRNIMMLLKLWLEKH